jgi:hypothetical protein
MLKHSAKKCKQKIHEIGKSELRLIKSSGLVPLFEFIKTKGLKGMIQETFRDYRLPQKLSFKPFQYFILSFSNCWTVT